MLTASTDDLHRHRLTCLMVEGLDHLSKSTATQTLQKFISVTHLLMLPPDVPALEIVLPHPASNPNIIDSFFVDQLNALILGQHRLEPLQNFLSG